MVESLAVIVGVSQEYEGRDDRSARVGGGLRGVSVAARFEELAWAPTPMGELSLRRRIDPRLGVEIFEVRLGDEYLMSSLFTAGETELARLGLARAEADSLDVLVGGLGLGYTAVAALDDPRVASLTVVDALAPVIDWHQRRLVPAAAALVGDARTRLVEADFFAVAANPDDGVPGAPGHRYHVVLVDIDHSPRHTLAAAHGEFYSVAGLESLRRLLHPGGVFALWSDDPPDDPFVDTLHEVFASVHAHVVTFPNPLTGGEASNTVYVATTPPARTPVLSGGAPAD
jgi:spermidine synthase